MLKKNQFKFNLFTSIKRVVYECSWNNDMIKVTQTSQIFIQIIQSAVQKQEIIF